MADYLTWDIERQNDRRTKVLTAGRHSLKTRNGSVELQEQPAWFVRLTKACHCCQAVCKPHPLTRRAGPAGHQ